MHIKDVLETARKAGFVATHYFQGSTGTVQLAHVNGNVLHVDIEGGAFTGATGYGWGDAPWAGRKWTAGDANTFVARLAG